MDGRGESEGAVGGDRFIVTAVVLEHQSAARQARDRAADGPRLGGQHRDRARVRGVVRGYGDIIHRALVNDVVRTVEALHSERSPGPRGNAVHGPLAGCRRKGLGDRGHVGSGNGHAHVRGARGRRGKDPGSLIGRRNTRYPDGMGGNGAVAAVLLRCAAGEEGKDKRADPDQGGAAKMPGTDGHECSFIQKTF